MVDLTTGITYTQTKYIALTTPWKSCTFTTTFSPSPSWISSSYNSVTGMLTINVLSTDLALKDTSTTINIALTADMKNSENGLPLDAGYSFSVSFKCKVNSLTFTTTIPNTSYALGVGILQTSAFLVSQSPSCGYTYVPSYTYTTASASSFVSFDSTNSKFSINTSTSAHLGLHTVDVTATMT